MVSCYRYGIFFCKFLQRYPLPGQLSFRFNRKQNNRIREHHRLRMIGAFSSQSVSPIVVSFRLLPRYHTVNFSDFFAMVCIIWRIRPMRLSFLPWSGIVYYTIPKTVYRSTRKNASLPTYGSVMILKTSKERSRCHLTDDCLLHRRQDSRLW